MAIEKPQGCNFIEAFQGFIMYETLLRITQLQIYPLRIESRC